MSASVGASGKRPVRELDWVVACVDIVQQLSECLSDVGVGCPGLGLDEIWAIAVSAHVQVADAGAAPDPLNLNLVGQRLPVRGHQQ